MIQQVLNQKLKSWSTYHVFKEIKTQISFKWKEGNEKRLWINIGSYSKMLNSAQIEILRLLLKHIIKEKIIYATGLTLNNSNENSPKFNISKSSSDKAPLNSNKNSKKGNKINPKTIINGSIKKETDHAFLIQSLDNKEIWIPKSLIKSDYNSDPNIIQNFLIDTWFLKKNNLLNT